MSKKTKKPEKLNIRWSVLELVVAGVLWVLSLQWFLFSLSALRPVTNG